MRRFRLITIPISPYCEKARWALDRLGWPYIEEPHLQVFHYLRTYWTSGKPMVPVLLDRSNVVSDSTAILKYLDRCAPLDQRLYPEDEEQRKQVEELEELFDEVLGVESRRWIYFQYLPHRADALRIAGQGTPLIERALAPLAYPLMRALITRRLSIHKTTVHAGVERSLRIVATTDALLADRRPFLVGEKFSAADLTLACMMAPFIMPPGYGVVLPRPEQLPTRACATVEEFRKTRTGQFVLRMFRQHRRIADSVSAPATMDMPGGDKHG